MVDVQEPTLTDGETRADGGARWDMSGPRSTRRSRSEAIAVEEDGGEIKLGDERNSAGIGKSGELATTVGGARRGQSGEQRFLSVWQPVIIIFASMLRRPLPIESRTSSYQWVSGRQDNLKDKEMHPSELTQSVLGRALADRAGVVFVWVLWSLPTESVSTTYMRFRPLEATAKGYRSRAVASQL